MRQVAGQIHVSCAEAPSDIDATGKKPKPSNHHNVRKTSDSTHEETDRWASPTLPSRLMHLGVAGFYGVFAAEALDSGA